MADREIHHYDKSDSGMAGMGAILGMILGVLLVGGLIFFFASDWDRPGDTKLTINTPNLPAATGETTGSAPRPAPSPSR